MSDPVVLWFCVSAIVLCVSMIFLVLSAMGGIDWGWPYFVFYIACGIGAVCMLAFFTFLGWYLVEPHYTVYYVYKIV